MRLTIVAALCMGLVVPPVGPLMAQSIVREPVLPPNPADLQHGAVLCSWTIYLTIREVGSTCHAGEDRAFRDELDRSIADIDAFIMRNGKVGPDYISTWKTRTHEQFSQAGICQTAAPEQFYQRLKQGGPEALRRATADLLSVPRMPVMNPCL